MLGFQRGSSLAFNTYVSKWSKIGGGLINSLLCSRTFAAARFMSRAIYIKSRPLFLVFFVEIVLRNKDEQIYCVL